MKIPHRFSRKPRFLYCIKWTEWQKLNAWYKREQYNSYLCFGISFFLNQNVPKILFSTSSHGRRKSCSLSLQNYVVLHNKLILFIWTIWIFWYCDVINYWYRFKKVSTCKWIQIKRHLCIIKPEWIFNNNNDNNIES